MITAKVVTDALHLSLNSLILSWFICKMKPWPLPHLPHKENPLASKALPVCLLPDQSQLLLIFLSLLAPWSHLLYLWPPCFTSSVVLCLLPRTWFLQIATCQTLPAPSSLICLDANLDQPFQYHDLFSPVTLQIFHIPLDFPSLVLTTSTPLC